MIEGSLTRRYTKALFQLAQEERREEATGEEIEKFLSVYTGSPLQPVLNNPAFSLENRKNVLSEAMKSLQLSALAVRFLSLLLERDRLTFLPGIVSSYRRFLNEAKGRIDAKVVGASPLEPPLVEKLRATLRGLSGKEIVLEEESDPALIGGVRIHLGGKVYDGSVRTQLEKMKELIARER